MPTDGAPTMLLSGIPMHRFKDTDPHADTLCKIEALFPVTGQALDTATGLGYTAIQLAHRARVITIEFDPPVLEIARRLKQAGFTRVESHYEAFGLLVHKD